MMYIENVSKRTDAEVMRIVARAMAARRDHKCHVNDSSSVSVHDGIHTQFDIHRAKVDIDDVTVVFWRYRQHSPCDGIKHEIDPPYGFQGFIIEAEEYWITINY